MVALFRDHVAPLTRWIPILLLAVILLYLNSTATHAQQKFIDRSTVYIIASALTDPAGGGAGLPSPGQVVSPLFDPLVTTAQDTGRDHEINITIPDMDPTRTGPRSGLQEGIAAGADVTVIVTQRAGFKNPTRGGGFLIGVTTSPPNGPANLVNSQVSPSTPGAVAEYRVNFTPTADLPANSGEITIILDRDVQLPESTPPNGKEPPIADLSVVQRNFPASATIGETVTYYLDVTNAGPSVASQVQLTEALPTGSYLTSATASQGSCNAIEGLVSCELGDLAADGTVTVSVIVRLSSVMTGSVQFTANVTANEDDPNPDDNGAIGTVRIFAQPTATPLPSATATPPSPTAVPTVEPTAVPTDTPEPTPTSQPMPDTPAPSPTTSGVPSPTSNAGTADGSPSGSFCSSSFGTITSTAGVINLLLLLAPIGGIWIFRRKQI